MSDHDHEYHSHIKLYTSVFGALCAFTLLSIAADLVHIPNRALLIGIVLAVAVCKALCVLLIFMHLKFERAWKYLLLAPTFILAFTIPFALAPDIAWTYYTSTAAQAEYEIEPSHHAGGHGDAAHQEADKHDASHHEAGHSDAADHGKAADQGAKKH